MDRADGHSLHQCPHGSSRIVEPIDHVVSEHLGGCPPPSEPVNEASRSSREMMLPVSISEFGS